MIFFRHLLLLGSLSLVFIFTSCNEKTNAINDSNTIIKFPSTSFVRAIAYDYEGSSGQNIYEHGKKFHGIKKEQILASNQVDNLLDILNDKGSYGGNISRCFKPRLGVIFYDKEDKVVGQVSICFECNSQQSTPAIKAKEIMTVETGNSGFSDAGRSKLIEFCKSLSFSNCGQVDAELQ